MPRVIRLWARLATTVVLACGAVFAPASPAAAAEGARLGLVHISSKLGASVATFDASGGQGSTLMPAPGHSTPLPFLISPASWSGDGQFLIAAALARPADESGRESGISIYAIPAEGGSPVAIPGTGRGFYPVGIPGADTVAFERVQGSDSQSVSVEAGSGKRTIHRTRSRTSIWIAHIDGGKPRQLTPWRSDGYDILTSASPDGSTLAFTKVTLDRSKRPTRASSEARFLDLRTGGSVPVGRHIDSAAFSPDGTHLALNVGSDIYVEDLATGALTQVTSGPGIDEYPAWDPSGQRLAFLRYGNLLGSEAAVFGVGDSIYEVNPDGSCLTRVLHEADGGFTAPAWQPGPDRGAGPISC